MDKKLINKSPLSIRKVSRVHLYNSLFASSEIYTDFYCHDINIFFLKKAFAQFLCNLVNKFAVTSFTWYTLEKEPTFYWKIKMKAKFD